MRLFICMYHYIRDLNHSRYPEIKGLDVKLFQKQIAFMSHHFNIVRMEQVLEAIKGNALLPDNALLLTFDDGYIDNYTYAMPILEENAFQGSFFIPGKTFATHQLLDVNKIHYILASANINNLLRDVKERINFYRGTEYDIVPTELRWEKYAIANRYDNKETIFIKRMLQTVLPEILRNRISSDLFEKYVGISEEKLSYELYMTEGQIKTMKRHGMFIGVHGYDHYWLGNLPEDKMKKDIDLAMDTMSPFIDPKCWVMNYPYGNYNNKVLEYISNQGAVAGLTTEVRIAELEKEDPLQLPRLDCNDFPPKSEKYKTLEKET